MPSTVQGNVARYVQVNKYGDCCIYYTCNCLFKKIIDYKTAILVAFFLHFDSFNWATIINRKTGSKYLRKQL